MPMHTYLSWLTCTFNLRTVAKIHWTQQVPHKKIEVNVTASKSKNIGSQQHDSADLPIMSNVHTKFGDCISNIVDTAGARIAKPRSQLQGFVYWVKFTPLSALYRL